MIAFGAFNAVARYAGRFAGLSLSSNAFIEAQWYLFAAIFLLAAAYTLKSGRHVRVDVLYGRLPPRGRAVIDVVGYTLFLIPFAGAAILFSWPSVVESWRIREVSPDPGGLPRYPLKTLLIIGFVLLGLQAFAELARSVDILVRGDTPTDPEPSESGRDVGR